MRAEPVVIGPRFRKGVIRRRRRFGGFVVLLMEASLTAHSANGHASDTGYAKNPVSAAVIPPRRRPSTACVPPSS